MSYSKKTRALTIILLSWIGLSLFSATPIRAQDTSQVITLDDNTPGVGVAIQTAPGEPGYIVVGLNHASVTLTNANGEVEFYMADPRARGVELALMADSGQQVLTLSRLPGTPIAYVTVTPQSALTPRPFGQLAPSGALTVDQQQRAILDMTAPEMTVPIAIPVGQLAAINASFPKTPLTVQIGDGEAVVATLYGGAVDTMSVTLDSGSYLMTLLNQGERAAVASLNVSSVATDSLASLTSVLPQNVMSIPWAQNVADMSVLAAPQQECLVTVKPPSVNLRGGPGTGYGVLARSVSGDQHVVAGASVDGSWLALADEASSQLWMFGPLGTQTGECSRLPVYDRPYLSAAVVSPSVAAAVIDQNADSGGNNSAGNSGDSDDNGDHGSSDDHATDDHSNGGSPQNGPGSGPTGGPGGGPGSGPTDGPHDGPGSGPQDGGDQGSDSGKDKGKDKDKDKEKDKDKDKKKGI